MNWLVLVRPAADRDLATARDWYEQRRPGLGDEFLDEIALAIRELEHGPLHYRLYYRDFRRVLLRRFPYKLFYQVIADRIVIFRVLHTKQEHDEQMTQ